MATYRVNEDGVAKARELIDDGKYDDTTEWSDAAPSADDENAEIDKHGYDGFGAWHLAIDPDASEETKGRYKFPVAGTPRREARCLRPMPDVLVTRRTRRETASVTSGA